MLPSPAFGEVDQARQEAGKRLAAPGWREEQRVAPVPREAKQRQLMGVVPPAARGERAGERLGSGHVALPQAASWLRSHHLVLLDLAFFLHQFSL